MRFARSGDCAVTRSRSRFLELGLHDAHDGRIAVGVELILSSCDAMSREFSTRLGERMFILP